MSTPYVEGQLEADNEDPLVDILGASTKGMLAVQTIESRSLSRVKIGRKVAVEALHDGELLG
jgi:hypothetical protein